MTGQLTFAFLTGALATVNPCGFAMLPTFLAFYVGSDPVVGSPVCGCPAHGCPVNHLPGPGREAGCD